MPEIPDTPAFTMPPDWICEVLSSSTRRMDRFVKLPTYARAGVEWVWLIDPEATPLEVLQRQGQQWHIAAVHAGDDAVEAQPFAAAAVDLSSLWLTQTD